MSRADFDVMILDLCMPEMDGYQVAEAIRYSKACGFALCNQLVWCRTSSCA